MRLKQPLKYDETIETTAYDDIDWNSRFKS